ncbi:MAG: hypothetical protein HY683_09730 [Chloroflexi bacterium]|nr:hypothetical protein [Chloroflexota bacterium]
MGVPFVPVRGLFGTDVLAHRPDFKVVDNPMNPGEPVVVCPPINPDVALFHAALADRFGNVLMAETHDELMMAQASGSVIVTAEQVVDGPLSHRDGDGTFIPGIYVNAVVPLPHGAHPTGVPGHYHPDMAHVGEYATAAKQEATFAQYLARYVYGTADEAAYDSLVGATAGRPS